MKCELLITSGARAGHREILDKSYIGIGRHPLSDLRFDAEKDLDASTRHAAIVKSGTAWVIRDLGSTNGTFVNGEKLGGDRALNDGDTLRFGQHGPEVSFHGIHEDVEAEVVMQAVKAPKPSATRSEGTPVPPKPLPADGVTPAAPMKPPGRTPPPPSKTSVLRAEISHQQQRNRWLFAALLVLIVGALGVVYWQGKRSNDVIAGTQHRADSLASELTKLRTLQARTDSEKTALQAQLSSERDPARRTAITAQIQRAEQRSAAIQQAQAVDYAAIARGNTQAVAIVAVRFPDSSMWEGTAFSVNAQGQMLTNRHLVVKDGVQAQDLAIRFHGSTDVLPARIVRLAPDADIAVLQIESAGPFPAIAGFSSAPAQANAPIALIGFPGGCGSCARPNAKLVSGTVTMASDSSLELDAFSGTGASGSPILDREGKVVGILYGGRGGSSSTEIVGLPISRALPLLR